MSKPVKTVEVQKIQIGERKPLAVMCGPCVIESEEHSLTCAYELQKIFSQVGLPLIFKSSYDKANRTAVDSFRGPGLEKGLRILEKVKKETGLPVVTDVHTPEDAQAAGEIVDILQIPAFLCRQTDLIVAAGNTGKAVSVKKGQFLAPWDMKNVVEKIASTGNNNIILTDRGTTFGYNNLITDFRSIPVMSSLGCPVCFDATHSVQLPGGQGSQSGGQREFIPTLARAAVAAGCHALFMEAHPNPKEAKSDAASVLPFSEIKDLLILLKRIHSVVWES